VTIGVKPLVKTPITPNQITTFRLITGVSAALFFAVGDANFTAIGSAVFILSLLLDRADGILARLTERTSPSGHKYDLISDTVSNAFVFIGIGVGLRHSQLGDLAIPLGFVAGLAVTAVFFLVIRAEAREGNRVAELKSSAGFDPDDGMLLVPLAMMLDFSSELIIAAAAGAPLFAVFFFFKFKHLFRA
jgi:archaetidylinositol phosphate synthase